ncbi:diguanylate cyclase [candidate division WOR-3 bacterium]|nr:diguanylate cyclase [candidate division WOR-3 bacterium]
MGIEKDIFEFRNFSVLLTDSELTVLNCGKDFLKIAEGKSESGKNVKISDLFGPKNKEYIETALEKIMADGKESQIEIKYEKDNREMTAIMKIIPFKIEAGFSGSVCFIIDATSINRMWTKNLEELKSTLNERVERRASNLAKTNQKLQEELNRKMEIEEELRFFASTDDLTGIYNRRAGLLFLEHRIKESFKENLPFLICFVDVNGLKNINDDFGHNEGDNLLVKLTEILNASIRESDVVFRLGGDEFIIIFQSLALEKTDLIWKRIRKNLDTHNAKEETKYNITVSYGFAVFDPQNPRSIEELISFADLQMYRKKEDFYKNYGQR